MQATAKKRVGILRGGKGKNYDSSIKKGGELIVFITENLAHKYQPVDIFIDSDGLWHLGGLPIMPANLVHKVDVVWNTADPHLSATLNQFSIPIVTAPHFSSMLIGSELLREHMAGSGIKMPRYIYSPKSAREVHAKFPAPWIVKNGSQVRVVKTFTELADALDGNVDTVVEEFISGHPGAVHTLAGFRGEGVYVLTPPNFRTEDKEKINSFAKSLHQHLGARHYVKSDFILHPRLGIYVTGIDFAPDIRPGSHLEESLHLVGTKMPHIVEHLLQEALK